MNYRFAVRTLVVPCLAMNHVRHVLRVVPGLASIKTLDYNPDDYLFPASTVEALQTGAFKSLKHLDVSDPHGMIGDGSDHP